MEVDWDEFARENFRYDSETGLLWWSKQGSRPRNLHKPIGSVGTNGYLKFTSKLGGSQKTFKVHRVIWFLCFGYWPEQIDHINGNRLDNRIENLRHATSVENTRNRKKPNSCKNKSQYKGVSPSKNPKKWRGRIKVNNKNIYLGSFDTEIEAALAYDKSAKELFGEFAKLNFLPLKGNEHGHLHRQRLPL